MLQFKVKVSMYHDGEQYFKEDLFELEDTLKNRAMAKNMIGHGLIAELEPGESVVLSDNDGDTG